MPSDEVERLRKAFGYTPPDVEGTSADEDAAVRDGVAVAEKRGASATETAFAVSYLLLQVVAIPLLLLWRLAAGRPVLPGVFGLVALVAAVEAAELARAFVFSLAGVRRVGFASTALLASTALFALVAGCIARWLAGSWAWGTAAAVVFAASLRIWNVRWWFLIWRKPGEAARGIHRQISAQRRVFPAGARRDVK